MTDQPLGLLRPEPKREKATGRYLLPHPETGAEEAWTRATTFASTVSDTYTLDLWKSRKLAEGLAARADLLAAIASTHPNDRTSLNSLCEDAREAAGANEGRRLGTALHAFAEAAVLGETRMIPEKWRADVAAYLEAVEPFRNPDHPFYVERIVVVPSLGVAGTLDLLVWYEPLGRYLVLDLKTGKSLRWSEIAVQLAIYAHGAALWNLDSETYEPMPEVEASFGLVAHVPAGSGRCQLWRVDLDAGWRTAVDLIAPVRAWRKRNDLAEVFVADAPLASGDREETVAAAVSSPTPGAEALTDAESRPSAPLPVEGGTATASAVPPSRTDWLLERLAGIPTDDREKVRRSWPTGVPPRPPWTTDQEDAISTVLHSVEEAFPRTDPALTRTTPVPLPPEPLGDTLPPLVLDTTEPAKPDEIERLATDLTSSGPDVAKWLRQWTADAKRVNRDWPKTVRGVAIGRAALACIWNLTEEGEASDELVRAALYQITGRLPYKFLGVEFASLTDRNLVALEALADRYGRNEDSAVASIGAANARLLELRAEVEE